MSNASSPSIPAFEPDEKMKTKILALKSMSTINGSSSTCCVNDIENAIPPTPHLVVANANGRIIISEEFPASRPPTPSVPSNPGKPSTLIRESLVPANEHYEATQAMPHPSIAALSTSERLQPPQSPPYYKPFSGPTIIPNRRAPQNSNDTTPGESMSLEGVYVTVSKEFRADGDDF